MRYHDHAAEQRRELDGLEGDTVGVCQPVHVIEQPDKVGEAQRLGYAQTREHSLEDALIGPEREGKDVKGNVGERIARETVEFIVAENVLRVREKYALVEEREAPALQVPTARGEPRRGFGVQHVPRACTRGHGLR